MQLTKYEIYHENKCHTTIDFPYNTYLCTIPLDFSAVNIHWHEEVEIIVIKKGTGIVSVNLTEYKVCEGDAVFIMSGQLHSISQLENSTMEYENILFRPSMLKATGSDLCWDQFISPLISSKKTICPLICADKMIESGIAEYIQKIDKLCDEKSAGYQIAVKGYLYLMLHRLVSEIGETFSQISQKNIDKIKTILSYVEQHYSENITVEEAAELCFYSKSYFMKFFKESMGVSFINYLNDYRLETAANMLRATDGNILEIACACGFDNLSYFNRSFKKKYKITPGKYRKAK